MFVPNSGSDREVMLDAIGIKDLADLFKDIPANFRFPKLNLRPALTEMEALAELSDLARSNSSSQDLVSFLGAGAYNHYIPAAIDAIIQRGEFLTAYTPYQPEVSQGTLQAIFEYQSLIAALTGMDVSNASHYDGATACAEAFVLAHSHFRGKRSRLVMAPSVHPHYRAAIRTYTQGLEGIEIVGDELSGDSLRDNEALLGQINANTALVIVQYPDFFGRIFDYSRLAEVTHQNGALLCVAVNPTALGLLKPPSEFGADIVVGEGQPLGIPLSYGGPYLGIFATRKEFVRKVAGRLVGETVDSEGQRAFVLTLTAREQHIRRDKATSNICTNQGLIALVSTVYLSLLGKTGLRQVAELCYHRAHYAAGCLAAIPGFKICSGAAYFHEFVVCCPRPVSEVNDYLLDNGILGGYDLGQEYPDLANHMLIAVTEMTSKEDIDLLCRTLEEFPHD
jgi:glycine dehydrogenase subunit 1